MAQNQHFQMRKYTVSTARIKELMVELVREREIFDVLKVMIK